MTKTLRPNAAVIECTVRVTSEAGTSTERSRGTTNNALRNIKTMLYNARIHAIYLHSSRFRGASAFQTTDYDKVTREENTGNISTKILDYDIRYVAEDGVKTKRIRRGKKYYWEVRKNGRYLRIERYKNISPDKLIDNVIDEYEDEGEYEE